MQASTTARYDSRFGTISLSGQHADEAGLQYPKHPILFIRGSASFCSLLTREEGSNAVTGPGDVPIAKCCQGEMEAVDYESELVFVFGKTCKDVPESEALGVILGYASSNDVSARKWQGIGEAGAQWTFSKGFDASAPFGPCLVSTKRIPDPRCAASSVRLCCAKTLRLRAKYIVSSPLTPRSKLTITGSRNGKVAQQSTIGSVATALDVR